MFRVHERVCTGFREIETDLAFKVIEAYQERRMDDFADALTTLKDLARLRSTICNERVLAQD